MTIQELADNFAEINAAFKAGDITADEYKNLLQGLEISEAIAEDAEALEQKAELNMIINAAIGAASVLS